DDSNSPNTLTDRAFDLAKDFETRVEKMLGDTVDLPSLFAGLKLSSDKGTPSWLEKSLGLTSDSMDKLARRMNPERLLMKLDGIIPENVRMPDVSLGGLQGKVPTLGQTADEERSSRRWNGILLLAMVAMGALALWKLWSWRQEREGREGGFRL